MKNNNGLTAPKTLDPATLRWVADDLIKSAEAFEERARWFRAQKDPALAVDRERRAVQDEGLAERERMLAQKYRARATFLERRRSGRLPT